MDEQIAIDPEKVKMTKTYSMSLADVNKIKEMAEKKDTSDAAIMHQAINLLYNQMMFPVMNEMKG